jgi:hypothetical protein
LAKRGLFVVLISRSADKLKESAAKLAKEFPSVETKTIVADFSSYDPQLYKHIRDELAGLEIGILVCMDVCWCPCTGLGAPGIEGRAGPHTPWRCCLCG